MRDGVRRLVFAALAACGWLFVLSGSAQAQSTLPAGHESTPASSLKLDYDAAARSMATGTALTSREAASFLRQGSADSGVGVGILGMLTWPNFDPDLEDPDIDVDGRSGWGIGGWVGGNRNGRVGFVGEFIYLVRNARSTDPGDSSGSVDRKFKVFEIPAVFHINFGSRSRNSVGGYVVVGPVFSFNLGQERNGESVPDDREFKGTEIGIIGGAGIEFFRIGIEGRGNWGLNSISDEGDLNEVKTFTFELLGKFAFN